VGAVVGALLKLRRSAPAAAGAGGHAASAGQAIAPELVVTWVLWLGLSLYWEISARGVSAEKTSEARGSRLFHLTLVALGQGLLLVPIPGYLSTRLFPRSPAVVVAGLGLELASVLFSIWARRALGRHWSGAITTKVDHELVRSGPYRWVRHPIYSGMFGLSLGTFLVAGEVRALVGMVIVVVAFWRKIRLEERHLSAVFGPAYEEYRSSTWAVIPRVL